MCEPVTIDEIDALIERATDANQTKLACVLITLGIAMRCESGMDLLCLVCIPVGNMLMNASVEVHQQVENN